MQHAKESELLLVLFVMLMIGCNYSKSSKPSTNSNNEFITTKTKCLDALNKFADTLKVDNIGSLNDTNKYRNIVTKNCQLKNYRHDIKMQLAIVLIVLKFYNYDLKRGWMNTKAELFSEASKFTADIIFEYAYLYYGKERYYTEDLDIDDIISLLKKNPIFLKDPRIKKQYDDSFKLRNR